MRFSFYFEHKNLETVGQFLGKERTIIYLLFLLLNAANPNNARIEPSNVVLALLSSLPVFGNALALLAEAAFDVLFQLCQLLVELS